MVFFKNTIVCTSVNENLICLKNIDKNIAVVSKIFLIYHCYHYLFLVFPIHGNNNKSWQNIISTSVASGFPFQVRSSPNFTEMGPLGLNDM